MQVDLPGRWHAQLNIRLLEDCNLTASFMSGQHHLDLPNAQAHPAPVLASTSKQDRRVCMQLYWVYIHRGGECVSIRYNMRKMIIIYSVLIAHAIFMVDDDLDGREAASFQPS